MVTWPNQKSRSDNDTTITSEVIGGTVTLPDGVTESATVTNIPSEAEMIAQENVSLDLFKGHDRTTVDYQYDDDVYFVDKKGDIFEAKYPVGGFNVTGHDDMITGVMHVPTTGGNGQSAPITVTKIPPSN